MPRSQITRKGTERMGTMLAKVTRPLRKGWPPSGWVSTPSRCWRTASGLSGRVQPASRQSRSNPLIASRRVASP